MKRIAPTERSMDLYRDAGYARDRGEIERADILEAASDRAFAAELEEKIRIAVFGTPLDRPKLDATPNGLEVIQRMLDATPNGLEVIQRMLDEYADAARNA